LIKDISLIRLKIRTFASSPLLWLSNHLVGFGLGHGIQCDFGSRPSASITPRG